MEVVNVEEEAERMKEIAKQKANEKDGEVVEAPSGGIPCTIQVMNGIHKWHRLSVCMIS